nr:restriction endonuclease subunit S [Cohnella algarum]
MDLFGDPIKNAKSWKISKLKEVSELITDGTHHSPEPMTEGIPYITAKHVKVNNIDFYSNPTYISESDHTAIYKRCPVKKGDILYIKDGATTGIAAINPYEFEFSMLSSLALIRIDIKYATPQYVVSYLNNQYVKEQITNNMSGAAIKRLTLAKINDIKIPIPDLETQHKYVGVFERYLIQKGKLIESLQQLESNFQALLQKAFKGELIVRDGVTV